MAATSKPLRKAAKIHAKKYGRTSASQLLKERKESIGKHSTKSSPTGAQKKASKAFSGSLLMGKGNKGSAGRRAALPKTIKNKTHKMYK